MSTRVKRKVKLKIKIKWKNLFIMLIFLFLLIFGITEIIVCIGKIISSPKTEEKIEKTEKKDIEVKTPEAKKLNKLNNINEKIDYFNNNYIDRYISYKEKNNNLTDEQIIKNVNMNLDLKQYEDKIKAKNLNKTNILVNKYYYLEEDYVPNNLKAIKKQYALDGMKLVEEACNAFENMAKAAEKEKLTIVAMSAYRSYSYQVSLYNRYVKSDGKEAADTYSGRPGQSEHQTGLAVDVYNQKETYTNFEKTKEFTWMQNHASEYGFILRFPKNKENETGYIYESWHYRYVGVEIAKYIKEHNISYEEYYATIIKDW